MPQVIESEIWAFGLEPNKLPYIVRNLPPRWTRYLEEFGNTFRQVDGALACLGIRKGQNIPVDPTKLSGSNLGGTRTCEYEQTYECYSLWVTGLEASKDIGNAFCFTVNHVAAPLRFFVAANPTARVGAWLAPSPDLSHREKLRKQRQGSVRLDGRSAHSFVDCADVLVFDGRYFQVTNPRNHIFVKLTTVFSR